MSSSDNWVVLKIKPKDTEEPFYKLLRGFSGSYLYGSSWAMNSGIESVELLGDLYVFNGFSGSSYEVHKDRYGVRMNIAQVIAELEDKYPDVVKVMPDCDWSAFRFTTERS